MLVLFTIDDRTVSLNNLTAHPCALGDQWHSITISPHVVSSSGFSGF